MKPLAQHINEGLNKVDAPLFETIVADASESILNIAGRTVEKKGAKEEDTS